MDNGGDTKVALINQTNKTGILYVSWNVLNLELIVLFDLWLIVFGDCTV